jgi:hypothetical protein
MTNAPVRETAARHAPSGGGCVSLQDVLKEHDELEGALTVVLGGMSAGKNAVGLAFARAVLAKEGVVAVCQPGERGAMRSPLELEKRLSPSMDMLGVSGWTSRLFLLRPTESPTSPRPQHRYAAAIEAGDYLAGRAQGLGWHHRMLVIQDYNVLWRAEPELTPARLRALALANRMNVVLLVDVTGGDREIARVQGEATAVQDQPLVTLLRTMLEEERFENEEVELIERHLPHLAAAIRGDQGAITQPGFADAGGRSVRVHAGQVQLVEAAHRVVYVEKVALDAVAIHTLKSREGPAGARRLELDSGFLAWPPERLLDLQPNDRERLKPRQEASARSEAPRG